jgi:hypothetical protein
MRHGDTNRNNGANVKILPRAGGRTARALTCVFLARGLVVLSFEAITGRKVYWIGQIVGLQIFA